MHGLVDFFQDQWPILSFFVAVASETDHWPLEHARLNCAPDYLKRVDQEIEDYLSEMRPQIERVCAEVLRLFVVDNPK